VLAPEVARLPALLRSAGYRTAVLSSNTLISPRFGLTEGFDAAWWGAWWEPYIRSMGNAPRKLVSNGSANGHNLSDRFRDGPLGKVVINSTETLYRLPFLFDSLDLLSQHMKRPGEGRDISASGWIEPTLSSWLETVDASAPVFCLVNICDTHEPYFVPEGIDAGVGSWWRQTRVRQDFVRCISGEWKPTPRELATLRGLYRSTVRNSDRRLRQLLDAFRAAGRWDNTLLIATSDHGQAFGEHGELFHLNGVIDPMLRIPLLFRPPGGARAPATAQGWASLIDVAPTVSAAAGIGSMGSPSAVELGRLVSEPRPDPVYAVSDGLVWNHLKRVVPEDRRPEFDRLRVVAYYGRSKLVLDSTSDGSQLFDLATDPEEERDLTRDRPQELGLRLPGLREVAGRMTASEPVPLAKDVEDRLRAWGY
jgi:arylsulfatase A-like enzyme